MPNKYEVRIKFKVRNQLKDKKERSKKKNKKTNSRSKLVTLELLQAKYMFKRKRQLKSI